MKMKLFNSAALMLGAVICASCGGDASSIMEKLHGRNEAPEPVTVVARRVEPSGEVTARTYVGRVEASQNVTVSSQFPGRVENVAVKKGQRVKEGETVAVLKSESIESTYEVAKATLEQARDAHDRFMRLYPNGGVTEVQKVEVQTKLKKAEASFAAAESALEKCSVKAPCSGVVERIFVEQGEEIAVSAPLVRIMNLGSVEVHIPVPENEISSLRTGQRTMVEVPAAGKAIYAEIAVKGVDASPLSHSYECVLIPAGRTDGLLPGMVCKVMIQTDGGIGIVVPMRSVLTDSEGRYVWCADSEGVISKRKVVCGSFSEDGVMVLDGLREGDLLVVEGHRKVSSGMKVNVKME